MSLFLALSPVCAWSQATTPYDQSAPALDPPTQQSTTTGSPASPQGNPPAQSECTPKGPASKDKEAVSAEGQQTSRMFWVVPNFAAVSAGKVLPPLCAREKYALATQDSVDYSSFIWAGLLAGQSMALKSDPELHQGLKGYGRYYWRAFVDQAAGAFFTEAIVPSLTHEDPRYYTLGQGGFFHRASYALSRVVVTKKDSGRLTFNASEVLGNGLAAGLSNLYYPPEERSLGNTAHNWATQIESAALNNVIKEFWPDIRRKVFRQK